MDRLRAALPLARMLFALSERRRSVTVRVVSGARVAELSVLEGRARSLCGVDSELLGDALLRTGSLDPVRHDAALRGGAQAGRVGEWLVGLGVVSRGALAEALVTQLHGRVGTLLAWPRPDVRLTAPLAVHSEHSVDLRLAVWDGLVRIAEQLPHAQLESLAGDGALTLTRTGAHLLEALRAREPAHDQLVHAEPPASLCCARAVLRVLGAANESERAHDAYGLLLRKRREIKRRAPALALLDLTGPASAGDARKALRRLAARLHPDRFEREHPGLRALCAEVMCVLAQAEAELRSTRRAG